MSATAWKLLLMILLPDTTLMRLPIYRSLFPTQTVFGSYLGLMVHRSAQLIPEISSPDGHTPSAQSLDPSHPQLRHPWSWVNLAPCSRSRRLLSNPDTVSMLQQAQIDMHRQAIVPSKAHTYTLEL